MEGARKIKMEDISFESDTHNIYDPFFSSESEGEYPDTSSAGSFNTASYGSQRTSERDSGDRSAYDSEENSQEQSSLMEGQDNLYQLQ